MMSDSAKPSECVRYGHSWVFCALAAALFSGFVFAEEGEQLLNLEQLPKNPHGDASMCATCHTSDNGGRGSLVFDADVSELCQSCHDGWHATREAHPVNLMPSVEIAKKIPSDFPLDNGKLTCSTCHDITWACSTEQSADISGRSHLRGAPTSARMEFCFNCHTKQDYQPFNVHDQLEPDR
jgi:predicted CXXCH cytochrome family protein